MMILANIIVETGATSFLLVLILLMALTLAVGWMVSLLMDRSGALEPLKVEDDPDPYAIAYLRAGAAEIIQVIVFDLTQRGFLLLATEESIFRTEHWVMPHPTHPPEGLMAPLERAVFGQAQQRQRLSDLIHDPALLKSIEATMEATARAQVKQQLVLSGRALATLLWVRGIGLGGVLILGGYRLLLTQDMILMAGLVLGMALVGVLWSANARKLTERGKRYLEDLEQAYDSLRARQERQDRLLISHGLLLSAIYGPRAIVRIEHQEDLAL